jgi:hypothetical protein
LAWFEAETKKCTNGSIVVYILRQNVAADVFADPIGGKTLNRIYYFDDNNDDETDDEVSMVEKWSNEDMENRQETTEAMIETMAES